MSDISEGQACRLPCRMDRHGPRFVVHPFQEGAFTITAIELAATRDEAERHCRIANAAAPMLAALRKVAAYFEPIMDNNAAVELELEVDAAIARAEGRP